MKSFILSLALFQLLTGVHASVRAGPYTLMIEWHVYRMEVLRLGNGKTLVAPGCRGTVPDGSCYFDEFCKHIQMKKVWQGRTSAGHDLFPDIDTTARELRNSGYKFADDPNKLLPSVFPDAKAVKAQQPGFSKIFEPIIDRLQTLRFDAGADADQMFGRDVSEAEKSVALAVKARIADQAVKWIEKINDQLRPHNVVLSTFDRPDVGFGPWTEPDFEGTLRRYGVETAKIITPIIASLNTHLDTVDQTFMKHQRAIEACQSYQDRIYWNLDC